MKYFYLVTQLYCNYPTVESEEYATETEARLAAADFAAKSPYNRAELWLYEEGKTKLITTIAANAPNLRCERF